MINKLTFLIILILLSGKLFAQLTIDAGNDTIICVGMWGVDTTEIGGNQTATGGTDPYVYTWETKYTVGSVSFWASDFLDDTTKANPKIVTDAPENLKFILTVTDKNEIQMRDSVTIRFSRFGYTMEDYFANINQGDTVTLMHNIGEGIPPLKYSWSPDYNISDTSISNPKAWPDTDTDYQVYATDSAGCISAPDVYEISVLPAGISHNNKVGLKSFVFPNPVNNRSKIYVSGDWIYDCTIKVFNANGQIVLSDKMNADSYQIGNKINTSGLFIYIIFKDDELVSSGQFVKR